LQDYRLKIEHMSKSFPGVRALDDVQLSVKPGTVHALVGENGAGKSTLMKCIFGLYSPDSGAIEIDGEPIEIPDTQTALDNGISMIHQELNPIPYRNVIDNIWVGRFTQKGWIVDESEMQAKTEKLLRDLDFEISPLTLAKDLSVSQMQAVEIAKAISYDAKIIIMDEATSSLTLSETEHLFKIIKQLKNEGRAIIYISHRLEEIFEIADEVTVMRDGKYIGTWEIGNVKIDELIHYMVGRDLKERFPESDYIPNDKVILKVQNYTSADPRSFKDVSFEVRKGEIFGIGGLVGSKRTELVEAIFGLGDIASGKIEINGKSIENKNPRQAIANGFALLTEDRRANGIIPMLTVKDNTLAASYDKYNKNIFGYINPKKTQFIVNQICSKLDVRSAGTEVLIKNLSGGNQQKVLVGRWLLAEPNVLILDEPTRGVDVGAKYEIYKIIRELAKAGNAIIMVSSEMPELLGMSDRIGVMCEGRLAGVLDRKDATQVEVLRLATKFTKKTYSTN
jgi:methyl-galactoside transport system ATP-binding protein